MKLNNKGFGMGTLIFFICLFFVILLAVTYIAYTNGIEKKIIIVILYQRLENQ